MVTLIYKIGSEISGVPPPKKILRLKIKIWTKFWTTWQLDGEYLQNKTIYRRTENGVANGNLLCACAVNLVNFGLQMAKK